MNNLQNILPGSLVIASIPCYWDEDSISFLQKYVEENLKSNIIIIIKPQTDISIESMITVLCNV